MLHPSSEFEIKSKKDIKEFLASLIFCVLVPSSVILPELFPGSGFILYSDDSHFMLTNLSSHKLQTHNSLFQIDVFFIVSLHNDCSTKAI